MLATKVYFYSRMEIRSDLFVSKDEMEFQIGKRNIQAAQKSSVGMVKL